MDEEYLDRLRRLFGKSSQDTLDSETLRDMGKVAGRIQALEPYVGTTFCGCNPKEHLPIFYYLVRSLQLLGFLLLMKESEMLSVDEYPGSVWVTLFCKPERAELLRSALAGVKSFELDVVFDGVYLLTGGQAAETKTLSILLEDRAAQFPFDQGANKL